MAAVERKSRPSLYDDDEDEAPPAKKPSLPSGGLYADEKPAVEGEKGEKSAPKTEASSPDDAPKPEEIKADSLKKHAFLSVLGVRQGERDDMQDAHLLQDSFDLQKPFLRRCALYGVYDGHAGARAAKHVENKLPALLKTKLSLFTELASMEKSLKKTFTQCYKELDDAFLVEARKEKPVWKDGTTATTVLVLNDSIYVANIGDSKAIVARFKKDSAPIPVVLTVDHNPTMYDERVRIQGTGANVVNGRVNGILEVSRSIGDGPFKTFGVICAPDMRKCTITEEDRFLIVACDGLWKSFSDEDAIKFVEKDLQSPIEDSWSLMSASERMSAQWQRTAERLAAEAVRRKCGDNVSVILVRLSKLPSE